MPLFRLQQLGLDEFHGRAGLDILAETLTQIGEQRLRAPEITQLEQRGADRHIGFGLPHAFIDGACRMADLQPEIPEQIENIFNHLLAIWRLFVGQQEKQIEVGERRHLAPPVTADRRDTDLLALGRVGVPVDLLCRRLGSPEDEHVHQIGVGPDRFGTVIAFKKPPLNLGPAFIQRAPQEREQFGAETLRLVGGLPQGIDGLLDLHRIDDFLAVSDFRSRRDDGCVRYRLAHRQ